MLEQAVHLVGQQVRAVKLRDRDESLEVGGRELCAGGAVRKVHDDHTGLGPHRRRHRVDVERPGGRVERHERHLRPDRQRDFVQRLVGRHHDHGVIVRAEQRVHGEEHRLLGAGEGA